MIKKHSVKNIFIEMPVYRDKDKDTFTDIEIMKKKGKFEKTVRVNQEIEADIFNVTERNYLKIMFRINQLVIGMVEIDTRINSVVLFPTIIGIAVKISSRGKGYSTIFYSWLIDYYKGIISDETLTGEEGHGSFQSWQKISKNYPTYIWKSKETAIIPLDGEIISDSMMKNKTDHFMAAKKPIDYKSYNVKFAKTFKMPSYVKSGIKLTEMPVFADKDKSLADDETFEPPLNATLKGSYPIKLRTGNGIIDLYQFNVEPATKVILLRLESGESVAVMSFDASTDSDLPFPTVMFVGVKKDQRSNGFSKIFYDFVIKKYKGIISDASLTGEEGYGSFQTWQSLAETYKDKTYMVKDDDTIIPISTITKDMMTSRFERFMVTFYPFDYKKYNEKKQLSNS